MNLLAVNYHYIDEEDKYAAGIYPVSPRRFRAQLEELGKFFQFVSNQDILGAVEGKKALPENSCVITFDDGLKGQYELAYPILDELKIPAIVFASGLPHAEGQPLLTHKIHWCRALLSPAEFFDKVAGYYESITGTNFNLENVGASDTEIRKQYLYDTIEEARLKYLLNKSKLLNDILRQQIIDKIFEELVADRREFCRNFYISVEGIKDLHSRSSFGFHGYAHRPMAHLDDKQLNWEIRGDYEAFSQIIGLRSLSVFSLSYPYGSPQLVSQRVVDIATKFGLKFGFTMERAINKSLQQPLLLARLDANDIPGGKHPLFEIKDGELRITDKRLSSDRDYNLFKEVE